MVDLYQTVQYEYDGDRSISDKIVGVVNDFAVLKRLVAADEQGLLFANHVRVECSLIDESYEDVVWIMSTLRNSNVHYDFPLVSSFCVKDDSGWAAVELDMRLNGACDGYEWHVFSELPMDSTAFCSEFNNKQRCSLRA